MPALQGTPLGVELASMPVALPYPAAPGMVQDQIAHFGADLQLSQMRFNGMPQGVPHPSALGRLPQDVVG